MTTADGSKIDILLVDDREENLLTLEAVLASPDYKLIKTRSGNEALRYLLDHEPALILLDVQMPMMDGFETATIIKENERTRDIPIIFVTAISKEEPFVRKGYQHGAVDYIYKPYDPNILKSKVAVFAELAKKTKKLLAADQIILQNEKGKLARRITELELKNVKREQMEQKKYLDLVEGINHGIVWAADANTLEFSFVSPSAERILGYPSAQWSAEKGFLTHHMHPEGLQKFLDAVKTVKSTRKDAELEHRFYAQSGKEVWLHSGIRIAAKADNSGDELRGLSVDITKIKEAENALRDAKKHSDFMAEASLKLSESLDYDITIQQINKLVIPRLADWYTIHLAKDNQSLELVAYAHSDGNKANRLSELSLESVKKVFETGESELFPELTDRSFATLETHSAQINLLKEVGIHSLIIVPLFSNKKICGVMSFCSVHPEKTYDSYDLLICEDLARRAVAAINSAHYYRQAQAAIQTRDDFLSVASHELKTPLTPLRLQTQILMRNLRKEPSAFSNFSIFEKSLETSDRQIEKLTRLIDELLDISRMSNGKLMLTIQKFDFVELIEDVIDRFREQLKNAHCEIKFTAPQPILVEWDRSRIEQVVTNLLTNAIKYAPGKPILVRVDETSSTVHFSVQDFGIGIKNKDLNRIFDRFERAASSTHFGGLGLGLYIVSQILEAHGAKIEVQSEFGQGSTFTVTLPLKAARIAEDMPGLTAKPEKNLLRLYPNQVNH